MAGNGLGIGPDTAFIVHAADLHLDFKTKQVQRLDDESRNVREHDFFRAFEALVEGVLALPFPPKALVIAGDLFHTPRPTQVVVKGVIALLNRLEAAGIEVVIIAGNHDTPQQRVTTSAFESLMEIEYGHIHFAYDAVRRVTLGDTEYVLVPHLALAGGLDPEDLRPDRASARRSVLVAHGVAGGSDLFRQLDEQRETPIHEYLLTLGHDYVALGHHHRLSMVLPGVWYSGSLENTAFGKDASHHRGGLVVDLDAVAANPEGYRPPLLEVPVRPMVDVPPIDAAGLSAEAVLEAIRSAVEPHDLAGALVRLTVRGITRDVLDNVDRAAVRALGKAALAFRDNWELRQVETQLGEAAAEGIRSIDLEYADAVAAYYAAREGETLPPREDVLERGLSYVRTFMDAEEETGV